MRSSTWRRCSRTMRRKVSVLLAEGAGGVPALMEGLGGAGALVSDFDFEKRPDSGDINVTFEVQFPVQLGTGALIALLEAQPGVLGIQVRQPYS